MKIYYIIVVEWNDNRGKVFYGDKLYTTKNNADEAHLPLKKNQVDDLIHEKPVAKGCRIDNN